MQQFRKFFFSYFWIIILAACGAKPLSPLSQNATIVAFGDSLTQGVGTTRDKSYPAVLAEISGRNVINAGISGETTTEGLGRFASVLEQNAPELVILIEGGNDILRNHSHAQAKQNLADMIQIAQAQSIPVVLLGVPEKNLFSDAAPLYAELASEFDLVIDKAMLGKLLKSPSLKSDQIHLNAKGYRKMAEEIHALLQKNGAF
ncbi:MAG: arylesterase [Gammaproteobacteria bacterium]|nr:arylesterase [Gammaproteobacteria bacterium]